MHIGIIIIVVLIGFLIVRNRKNHFFIYCLSEFIGILI